LDIKIDVNTEIVHSNCRVLERIIALINPSEYIFSNEMVLELEGKDLQI
jgi:hypothetical protein